MGFAFLSAIFSCPKSTINFIAKLAIEYSFPIVAFKDFKCKIFNELLNINYKNDSDIIYKNIEYQIAELQKNFIIVYVDKVSEEEMI
ncbi:UNVERIFIED_CONTAM: hypothetical protein NCL1_07088 [Trichonephila clavipes]